MILKKEHFSNYVKFLMNLPLSLPEQSKKPYHFKQWNN